MPAISFVFCSDENICSPVGQFLRSESPFFLVFRIAVIGLLMTFMHFVVAPRLNLLDTATTTEGETGEKSSKINNAMKKSPKKNRTKSEGFKRGKVVTPTSPSGRPLFR